MSARISATQGLSELDRVHGRRRWRRGSSPAAGVLAVVMAAALVLQVLGWALAGPAAAHGALSSTSPTDGERLQTAPTEVVLNFNEIPLALGTAAAVTDASGTVVSTGQLQVDERRLTQQLQPDLPAGEYRIAWRATSADGHPVSGELGFTVAVSGDTAAPTDADPTSATTSSPTEQTAQPPQISAPPAGGAGGGAPGQSGSAAASSSSGLLSLGALITAGAAIVLVLAVALNLQRRRRSGLSGGKSLSPDPAKR